MKKFFILLLVLASCHQKPAKNTVLVTVPPYAYFVERVAGDAVHVAVLVPPGANPHVYEPSPKQIRQILSAKVWFRIGEPTEARILHLLKERGGFVDVDLSKNLPLISNSTCGDDHVHEDAIDRHMWLSPRLVQEQVKMVAESLCQIFPENAPLFRERSENLIQELKALDAETTQELKSVHGDAILVSHPAFGYYCRDYDLIQISVECEGKDPKPQDIKRLLADARKYHVTSILVQKQYNNRGAEAIAKDLNISAHEFDPYAFDYFTNMKLLNTLVAHENSH